MLAIWFISVAAALPGFGLGKAVKAELADPALEGVSVSVRVDNARGRPMVDAGGELRLVPASTVKWVTAVAAADLLGLDHRFRTRFTASGHLEGSTLVGDLVMVGSGDPSLAVEGPEAVLAAAVFALQQGGVRRIEGRVLVADDVFGDGPLGTGWMWDDLRFTYSAPFGSVNLGHNLPQPGLQVCETVDGPGTPIKDPDLCAAQAIHEALTRAGIHVVGEPAVAPRPDELTDLVVWESPPLRDLLRIMLRSSDNLYAECIVRALDRDGVRTFRGARAQLEVLLDKAGARSRSGARLADGSGLSRYSMLSSEALVEVTAWAMARPWGGELRALLAVLGRSGTLETRGLGSPAEGRVWAKTGSMSGVRNIVGIAIDARGRPVHFAVLFNGLTAPRSVAIELQDRILALIAVSRGRWLKRKDRIAALGGDG